MPGAAAKLDASGNVSRATVNQVLTALKGVKSQTGRKSLKNDLFVGTPSVGFGAKRRGRAGAQAGIYRREGKRLRPVFIFTKAAPDYWAKPKSGSVKDAA